MRTAIHLLLTYLLLPRLCTSVVFIESVVFVAPLDAASESSSKDDRSKTGEASSIDLEWEHEAGLFVCTLHCFLLLVCVCVCEFLLGGTPPCPSNIPGRNTHPFNGPFFETTQVSRYQKGKTNLYFTEARDSEWQWHQLGHMQVYTALQTDNHASTPPLSLLQAGCPSCHPTNSVKALKANIPGRNK